MGFKPSPAVKDWKIDSKVLNANKSSGKSFVDFHSDAGGTFKPHFARVKAKLAKLETAQTKLVAAGKQLPKLFKAIYDQAPKIDAQSDKILALEKEILSKEKELKKSPKDATLKREFDQLVAQHTGQVRVLKQMVTGLQATRTNFDNVQKAAAEGAIIAQDIQGM